MWSPPPPPLGKGVAETRPATASAGGRRGSHVRGLRRPRIRDGAADRAAAYPEKQRGLHRVFGATAPSLSPRQAGGRTGYCGRPPQSSRASVVASVPYPCLPILFADLYTSVEPD